MMGIDPLWLRVYRDVGGDRYLSPIELPPETAPGTRTIWEIYDRLFGRFTASDRDPLFGRFAHAADRRLATPVLPPGVPLVITGTGPSLEGACDDLRRLRDRLCIASSLRGALALQARGLHADLVLVEHATVFDALAAAEDRRHGPPIRLHPASAVLAQPGTPPALLDDLRGHICHLSDTLPTWGLWPATLVALALEAEVPAVGLVGIDLGLPQSPGPSMGTSTGTSMGGSIGASTDPPLTHASAGGARETPREAPQEAPPGAARHAARGVPRAAAGPPPRTASPTTPRPIADAAHRPLLALLEVLASASASASGICRDCGPGGGALKPGWPRASLHALADTATASVQPIAWRHERSVSVFFDDARHDLAAVRPLLPQAQEAWAMALQARAGNMPTYRDLTHAIDLILAWGTDPPLRRTLQRGFGLSFLPRFWRSGIRIGSAAQLWRPLVLALHELTTQVDRLDAIVNDRQAGTRGVSGSGSATGGRSTLGASTQDGSTQGGSPQGGSTQSGSTLSGSTLSGSTLSGSTLSGSAQDRSTLDGSARGTTAGTGPGEDATAGDGWTTPAPIEPVSHGARPVSDVTGEDRDDGGGPRVGAAGGATGASHARSFGVRDAMRGRPAPIGSDRWHQDVDAGRPGRVTVLVPLKNGLPHLNDAMASLIAQTHPDIEILVIDDGSEDGGRENVLARAMSNVRLIASSGQGIAAALNTGLRVATGAFVARQDADDWSHPERLARQFDYLTRHPEIDVVATCTDFVDAEGRPVDTAWTATVRRQYDSVQTSEALARWLPRACCLQHASMMARRDALRGAGGYRPAFLCAAEYDLSLRQLPHTRFAKLPARLYTCRVHERQASHQQHDQQRRAIVRAKLEFVLRQVPRLAPHPIARPIPGGAPGPILGPILGLIPGVTPGLEGRPIAPARVALAADPRSADLYRAVWRDLTRAPGLGVAPVELSTTLLPPSPDTPGVDPDTWRPALAALDAVVVADADRLDAWRTALTALAADDADADAGAEWHAVGVCLVRPPRTERT